MRCGGTQRTPWGIGAVVRGVLLLALAVVGGGLGGCSAGAPRPLTPEVRAQTFDLYWGELSRHYPFFDISGVDWEAERERWRPAAVDAETPSEFYGVLASMLSGLDDPHVMLQPVYRRAVEGGGAAAGLGAGERASSPSIGLAWIGRRLHVRRWPAGVELVGGGVPPGGYPEVLSVNGVPPQRNMTPLLLYGPEYTGVELEVAWGDGSRRTVRLVRPSADFGGNARSGWASMPEVVHPPLMAGTVLENMETMKREVAVRWDDGAVTWVEFDDGAGTPVEVTEGITSLAVMGDGVGSARVVSGGRGGVGGIVERRAWGDWLTSVDLGAVGYLRVATLDYEDAAGGITVEEMTAAFDAAVNGLMERPAIILDLRYNGGGRPQSLAAMAGRFVERPAQLTSPQRRFAGVVPYRYTTRIGPRRPVYGGRVVVLINEHTGSAAEHWASILRRETGAKVVGERSTGAEALVEIVRGPDGSELRYGWLRFVDERGSGIQGVGVVPDVEVGLTIERVREIGYAEAVAETERMQFLEACRVLGVDGEGLIVPGEVGEVGWGGEQVKR